MEPVKNTNTKRMNYKSLLIENIKYRTLLTEKYKQRKPFQKKNIKELNAFLPGTIIKISVKVNSKVKVGDKLLVLEAMKMKNDIVAHIDGTINNIHVRVGDRVKNKQLLFEFE